MDPITYFMLRVQRARDAASTVVYGTLQDLSTGEKRAFGDTGELVDLLRAWSEPREANLDRHDGAGNSAAR